MVPENAFVAAAGELFAVGVAGCELFHPDSQCRAATEWFSRF